MVKAVVNGKGVVVGGSHSGQWKWLAAASQWLSEEEMAFGQDYAHMD